MDGIGRGLIGAMATVFRSPFEALRRRLARWLFQLHEAEPGEVFLHHRRVFVLPTQAGLGFLLLLAILFVSAVNYSLSLGFALTFLLASCGVADIYLSFRNLAHLHLAPGCAAAVFAGSEAQFELRLINRERRARYAISLGFIDHGSGPGLPLLAHADVAAEASRSVMLAAPARARGWLQAPRVRLQSRFPLGLVRAWSYWRPDLAALVYPFPEQNAPPLPLAARSQQDGKGSAGHDDFAGVRGYRAGDAPKHLAWRQIAKVDLEFGGALLTKQFDGGAASELCLDFDALPATLEPELKLSRLTRWVLDADAHGLDYALRLGSIAYQAASGAAHRQACLRALALYPDQA
jgi:uncharacterized protein (DUF58 family)